MDGLCNHVHEGRKGYSSGVIRGLAVLLAALVLPFSTGAQLPRSAAPTLVLYNAKVITVDAAFSIAEAIAIAGERMMAVGTNAQMRAVAGPATRLIDLQGRTLMPGLMDHHLHGAGGGSGIDLSRSRSLADVAAAVSARVTTVKPGDVILSNSDWHEAQLQEQHLPLRDDLDRVAPANPVILVRGGHEYILNSAALTRSNITEKTDEPAGGRITRYADGRLNGELVDTARALVRLPPPRTRTPDELIAAHVADYKKLNAVGLTTVRHPGVRGELTMRLNVLMSNAGGTDASSPPLLKSGIDMGEGDEWLRVGGVKLAVDGGFEGGLMREPYEEPWGEQKTFRGLQTIDTERFVAVVRAFNQQDWRVATHAVGDAAIDLVLNAYEKAHAEQSIAERRWSIEPGKLADLIVLNEDPLTCPEPRLRDAQVMMTIVGGKTVFER